MKIEEFLSSLPVELRERMLGRLEGMSMAMRICRNRAEDLRQTGQPLTPVEASLICADTIRMVQVQLGSGRQAWGDLNGLTVDELLDIWRIY